MAGVKEKLGKLRKGSSATGAAEPALPAPAALPAPFVSSNRATDASSCRFGSIKGTPVGDFSGAESGGEGFIDHDQSLQFEALPVTPVGARPAAGAATRPAGTFANVPRATSSRDQSRAGATRPDEQTPAQPIDWSDTARPAGSSYSIEEWEAAEEGGKNVVFEMVKTDEIGLCAVPLETMNGVEAQLYARSLVVSEDVPGAARFPNHAAIVHRDPVLGERGVMRYRVVRAKAAIEKAPWLNGSILRNDLELAYQESKAAQTNSSRFGNMPRARG